MNSVARSGLARLGSFLPTAVATLLTSRVIVREFGVDSFSSFALVLALISIIPVNNIGVGAAITLAYAEGGPDSEHSRRTTLTALRVLTGMSTFGVVLAALLTVTGAWPVLLGASSGPNLYSGLAMGLFSLSFLPGVGQSMLLGTHRNHVTVVVQTLFTPLILLGTATVLVLNVDGDLVMLAPPAALLVTNLLTAALARRATGVPWRPLLGAVPRRARHPGASIRAITGPYLLMSLATPIAIYGDRIVLSHVSTSQELARYAVTWQIFAPALALIAATAQPLWPMFASARAEGRAGPPLLRTIGLFAGAGVVVAGCLAVVANPIARLIGGSATDIGVLLPVLGAMAVVTSATTYPVSMSLMDPSGARFLAVLAIVALPLNLAISIVLGSAMGAPGPLIATLVVGIGVQTVPALLHSARRERARARGLLPVPAQDGAGPPTAVL